MARIRKRLVFLTVLLLVAAGLLGAFIQFSTRNALLHAEAFQFRRMLVTRLDDQGPYRFFYVTNRNQDSGIGELEKAFGSEREPGLRFGLFDSDIESSLGIGMLINPSDWFQNEEIQIRRVQALEREAFVSELRGQVERSPYRSLLININGFRERFPSALRKTAFVAHVLDIDTPMMMFDWPGDQGSSPRGYRRAQQVARDSGRELADTLRMVLGEVRPQRVWILANSMGGEVVANAFAELYQDPEFADITPEIEDVILTAPDVSRAEFDRQFKDEINALVTNLTVYVSSNDRALLMSRVLNLGRRLGESTVDPSNPDMTDEAAGIFGLVDPDNELVTMVDVTPVNRTRNFHNFSLETPEFFDDLYLRLTNAKTPRSRLQYRVKTTGGREYWVLTRGR